MNFIKKFRTRKSFKPGHSNKLHLPKDNAQEQQTQQLQQAPIQVPEPEPKPSDEQVEVATTIDSMASTLTFKPLHPTFGAEVQGVDFSVPIEDQLLVEQIKKAVAKYHDDKYGVCVFRGTQLDDARQIAFARRLGEVETLKGTPAEQSRLKHIELTDQSNLEVDGSILDQNSIKAMTNKGNTLFHVDGSYNVRRTRFSMLRACEIPPLDAGGNTEYIDTRTAFAELPEDWKDELLARDYVTNHSFWHSRKAASPDFFAKLDPDRYPFSKHRLVQWHLPSDRLNLYLPSHVRNIDGLLADESATKLDFLRKHVTRDKYLLSVPWLHVGDLVIWDNTCTLHRATDLKRQCRRDMRRCGIFDDGVDAYGLNPKDNDLNFAFSKEVMTDILQSMTS